MTRVVLDIETLGFPLDSFDETQQRYLLKFAQNDQERAEAVQKLSLYPTTAQILAIGMWNPDTHKGKILLRTDEPLEIMIGNDSTSIVSGNEKELLIQFWEDIAKFDQFITFNGRGFDCPFLMMRSAILQVKPSRHLMPYRYDASVHCDLLEQFTFYGALRKFSLDFYCKAFGIDSPKSHGITGLDMGTLFTEERFLEIAEYCLRDLQATEELYRRWEEFLKV